jgi:two-component system chemotaxis sensor kinase CheA
MPDAPMNDEMKEIVNEFLVESQEVLEGLDQRFVALEKNPNDTALLNEIFRAAHSVKGSAGFLGFTRLVEIAHQAESILNLLRQGERQVDPAVVDSVLEAVDVIKLFLKDIKETGTDAHVDVSAISTKLAATLAGAGSGSGGMAPKDAKKSEPAETAGAEAVVSNATIVLDSIEVELEAEPGDAAGAPLIDSATANKTAPDEITDKGTKSTPGKQEEDQTIRIETVRLDHVMNLVGELVLGRNRLMKLSASLEQSHEGDPLIREVAETLARLDLVTTDLQTAVMKTRMLPIRKVLGKFPRMVRDLANKVGKKVTLELVGEDTELDKSVIEEIGDPLVHIIRNAIDHGVERPDERRAAAKTEHGTVRLEAAQEGDRILIRISDDGRGMSVEKLKAKALSRGIVTAQEISTWGRNEILNLIFQPGFSTAERVTDVSGRGVGMDVVRTNISRLNGSVELSTEEGRGCTVTIKLPLTIAIIQALMVCVDQHVFAIPLTSVIEGVKLSPGDLKTVNGQEVMTLRDQVLPVVRLRRVFDIEGKPQAPMSDAQGELGYVVVVAIAERQVGILVDRLQAREEVVMKSLGDFLGEIQGVAGATITGDGKVVLILDMAELVQTLHPAGVRAGVR